MPKEVSTTTKQSKTILSPVRIETKILHFLPEKKAFDVMIREEFFLPSSEKMSSTFVIKRMSWNSVILKKLQIELIRCINKRQL